MNHVDNNNIMY